MQRRAADDVKGVRFDGAARPRARPGRARRRSPTPTPSCSARRTRSCRSGRSWRCPGIREAVAARRDRCVGVSGIVGGAPARGDGRPADARGRARGHGGRRGARLSRPAVGLGDRRTRPRRSRRASTASRAAGRRHRHDHARRRRTPRRSPASRSDAGARMSGRDRPARGAPRDRARATTSPRCSRPALRAAGAARRATSSSSPRRSSRRRRDGSCPATRPRRARSRGRPCASWPVAATS